MDWRAHELQRAVADEGARQEPRLAQDLEAVADAHDRPAPFCELANGAHDRCTSRDRTGAKVVPIGEPAGKYHGVDATQVAVAVPERHAVAAHVLNGAPRVAIVQRPGERHHADPSHPRSISILEEAPIPALT